MEAQGIGSALLTSETTPVAASSTNIFLRSKLAATTSCRCPAGPSSSGDSRSRLVHSKIRSSGKSRVQTRWSYAQYLGATAEVQGKVEERQRKGSELEGRTHPATRRRSHLWTDTFPIQRVTFAQKHP